MNIHMFSLVPDDEQADFFEFVRASSRFLPTPPIIDRLTRSNRFCVGVPVGYSLSGFIVSLRDVDVVAVRVEQLI
jgi:hypothetical protein